MKHRILILSFYLEPDIGPGASRTSALLKELQNNLPNEVHLEVLTTTPQRYKSFSVEAPLVEKHPSVTIHRITLPHHESGLLDQTKAFYTFWKSCLHQTKDKEYALVFATSARLMTAALAARIASRKRIKLYLDIRDIFPESLQCIVQKPVYFISKPFISFLERWIFKKAMIVNAVSPGFLPYFKPRYPNLYFSTFTNGIDDMFGTTGLSSPLTKKVEDCPINVVYAGNIGEGQGLHKIIPLLAREIGHQVMFKIIGDGGRRVALKKAVNGIKNVEVLPPVPRHILQKYYADADVLFLHLNAHEAFKRVLPSKIFEYAATGKPIWAGVSGYAAQFIEEEIPNAAVFPPFDLDQAQTSFKNLKLDVVFRESFVQKYNRQKIMQEMAHQILRLGREERL